MLRDIVEPSAAIIPELVSCVVELNSSETITGIMLVDAEGKERPLPRGKIRQFPSSAISLMPDGFRKLGDGKLSDLVALLSATPDPKR